jgi:hypothetical protein
MPELGETISATQIGRKGSRLRWVRCPDCGQERWMQHNPSDAGNIRRCHPCYIKHRKGQIRHGKGVGR